MLSDQATLLNEVLSRYIILRHHLEQAHWFVEGPFFYSWHQMFEKDYDKVGEMIDSFAEKLRVHNVLKAKKMSLMSLEGQEPEVSAEREIGLLSNLLAMMQPLRKIIKEIIIDPKMSDFPTIIDELTQNLGEIDKMIWFYKASSASISK